MSAIRHQSMSCHDAVELLPWLINGSLERDERQELRDHLSACASCRHELEETRQGWELLARHVPSFTLARYAMGLPTDGFDRELMERHLGLCESCREELERAMSDRVVDFPAARAGRSKRALLGRLSHKSLAAAAGFAVLLASGAVLWHFEGTDPAMTRASIDAEAPADSGTSLFRNGFELGDATAWKMSRAGVDLAGHAESSAQNEVGLPTLQPGT